MNKSFKPRALALAVGASMLTIGNSAMAAIPAAATTALADSSADVLLAVAAGGAVLLTVRSAGVIWAVFAKFIGKLRGA